MVAVHRGAGMLVPIIGVLSALAMNVVLTRTVDPYYYQEHKWPKLAVLVIAGLCCLLIGLLINRKRTRDRDKEQLHRDYLSSKFGSVKDLAYSGPRDHLMFIPLPYWSIIYFAAAIAYAVW